MVPVFDMINHANDPNCDWTIEGGVRIWTDRDILAGEGCDSNFLRFNQKLKKKFLKLKN